MLVQAISAGVPHTFRTLTSALSHRRGAASWQSPSGLQLAAEAGDGGFHGWLPALAWRGRPSGLGNGPRQSSRMAAAVLISEKYVAEHAAVSSIQHSERGAGLFTRQSTSRKDTSERTKRALAIPDTPDQQQKNWLQQCLQACKGGPCGTVVGGPGEGMAMAMAMAGRLLLLNMRPFQGSPYLCLNCQTRCGWQDQLGDVLLVPETPARLQIKAPSRVSGNVREARVAIRHSMSSQGQLSGSQVAAGFELLRSECREPSEADYQPDAASSLQDGDQDEFSCCGSSASDGSLESSDISSCPSFEDDDEEEEEESDSDSEGEDGMEEVSSPMPGSSPRTAQQRQHQQLSGAVTVKQKPPLAPVVPLPLDWLAQKAIPTTSDLDEALQSNGQLAYVLASSAAPAATSLLMPSKAKAENGLTEAPTSLLGLSNKLLSAVKCRSGVLSTQSPPPRPATPPCASWRPSSAGACGPGASRTSSRQQRLCHIIHTTAGHGRVAPAKSLEVGQARRQAIRKQAALPSSLAVAAAIASRLSCPGRLERTSFQQMVSETTLSEGACYAGAAPLTLLPPSGFHIGSIRSQYWQDADSPMTAFVSH